MMFSRSLLTPSLIVAVVGVASANPPQGVAPPANAPAAVVWNAETGRLSLRYHGTVILDATVGAKDADGQKVKSVSIKLEPKETRDDKEKVEQRLKFAPSTAKEGTELVLRGTVLGSEEAFPAETRGEAQNRFPYVRNSVGLSRNLRNNAVYDRRWDWVLIGPADGETQIVPQREENQRRVFSWESRGASIELVFRPRFYQKHKELAHFEPWTYKIWEGPVTGFCTWWAYKHGFTQQTVDELTDLFAEKKLPDFGYNYIQLDDTYQIGNGSCPQNWLTWNNKFPGGPQYTIKRIRSIGMKPGIWVHRVHRPSDPHVADIGKQHPDWFVKKPDGTLFMDAGFYLLNTHNKEAVDRMSRRTYRELKKQGWDYVKIDGAGDLLYSYMNKQCAEHFKKIGKTPGQSLRDWDAVAREELGPEVYILNCWGVRPGLNVIGLADGCRLGSDGFGPAGLQQYNSFNGVVWRNDPDHCDIMAKRLENKTAMKTFAVQEAMTDTIVQPAVVSLAGAVLMVSDKIEDYKDDGNLEGMKRSAPVLFTVPGQLYDYDHRGRGNYRARLRGGEAPWWLLEIDRPFDHWSVLARFNWRQRNLDWKRPGTPETEVRFADLGLSENREYLVFEFWTQKFLGKFKDSFKAPAQDMNKGLQVFAIREAREHPWVLSTTRHISQGGVSLLDERWDGNRKVLSGKSAVVIGDPYIITVHLPEGFRLENAEVDGETVESANQKETATVRIVPSATKTVEWKMTFAKTDLLEIRNHRLRVTYETGKGTFSIRTASPPREFVRSGRLRGAGGTARVATAQDATFGQCRAIEVTYPAGGRDAILLPPKLPLVLFRSTVHNDTAEPLVVDKLRTVHVRLDLGRPAEELKVLGTGGLKSPQESPGSYMWAAVAEPLSRCGVVAGWITTERGSGVVLSGVEEEDVRLDAQLDYGRLRIAPGQSERLETFALGFFDDARLGLETYADAIARVYTIELKPQPCGYCTWYVSGPSNEQRIAEQSAFVAEHLAPFGFSVMQIDDGWQDGDSRGNGPRKNFTRHRSDGPYPSGMKPTAERIRSLGLVPGIWLMPFAGTHNDPWFADKQAWFVRRAADGKPYDTRWGGTCLDVTHPEVREYLRTTVHRIVHQWGYRYLKLDGLWTGSGTPQIYVNDAYRWDGIGDALFHNPAKTNVEAYRDGLKLVRQTAGSDVFLLGCCANQNMRSYGGAFGLIDAMRIGPDNGCSWRGILTGPDFGTRNYFLHGRVWYNDPDPIYVRPSLSVEQARVSCSWASVAGQLTIGSDDFKSLPPERLDILKRVMPAHGATSRPVDLFEEPLPRIWLVTDDRGRTRRDVVGLFNWGNNAQAFDCPLERIGLPATNYLVFDFWGDRLLPPVRKGLRTVLSPQSCLVLAVRPVGDRPQVLSTSRHVTQGIVDVVEETWDAASRSLSGTSRVVGGDGYELRVATWSSAGTWKPAAAELSAEDRAAGVAVELKEEPGLARVTIRSPESRQVRWKVRFEASPSPEPAPGPVADVRAKMPDPFGPVKLAWTGSGPFYEVRRDGELLSPGQAGASYADTTAEAGKSYRYAVVPFAFDGRRGPGAELTLKTPSVELGPVPPRPEVSLMKLKPRSVRTGWGKFGLGKSAAGLPLTLGETVYQDGIGLHANAEAVYDRKPQWNRFVAVVGIDEGKRGENQSSLICEVVAEGGGRKKSLGRTPVLRFGRVERWHFDVAIPADCARIHLVVRDAGDHIHSDHADWVNAGFRTD